MVRAVVFDCFGVLATDGWLPFRDHYFGHDNDLITQAVALNKSTDAGIISYDEFITQVAALAGVIETEVRKKIENNIPDGKLFEFIEQKLKPRYKLGLLSNAADNWLAEIFTAQQVALFDAIGLSYEIGAVKPAPIMYETIAQRLGVELSECIFIDDQMHYCEGAEAVGMRAIRYSSRASLIKELTPLL